MRFLKFTFGILVGLFLGTVITLAFATKYESNDNTAMPMVLYGISGSTLVPLAVDSNGVLQIIVAGAEMAPGAAYAATAPTNAAGYALFFRAEFLSQY